MSPAGWEGAAPGPACSDRRLPGLSVSTEVQFRPYRTDDFITRLYYETPRFTVLNQTWVLKARVNDSERNPNLSCKRTLSFQLLLKSKVTAPLECSFLLLKGPYDDVKIDLHLLPQQPKKVGECWPRVVPRKGGEEDGAPPTSKPPVQPTPAWQRGRGQRQAELPSSTC